MVMGEYIFGYTNKELLRLELQAELFENESKRTLELAGIKEGMNCIDIGCGNGYTSILLAKLVGPNGHVTAVDISLETIESAKRNAKRNGIDNIDFIIGDINNLNLNRDYDLVYSRFLFTHLENPRRALTNMIKITKPNGIIAIEDFNHNIRITYPYNESLETLRLMLVNLLKNNGSHEIGEILYDSLVKAGINTSIGLYSIVLPMNTKYKVIPFLFAEVLKERFIKAKLINEHAYENIVNGIKEFTNKENALLLYSSVFRIYGHKNCI